MPAARLMHAMRRADLFCPQPQVKLRKLSHWMHEMHEQSRTMHCWGQLTMPSQDADISSKYVEHQPFNIGVNLDMWPRCSTQETSLTMLQGVCTKWQALTGTGKSSTLRRALPVHWLCHQCFKGILKGLVLACWICLQQQHMSCVSNC